MAISQNRKLQRKEHKARLLGRIADWVIEIKTCSFIDIPFVKDLSEADLKNITTLVEQQKVNRYSSLVITGQYLKTLAVANKLGEQITKGVTETSEAVIRFWTVNNVRFGISVQGIKDTMIAMSKGFSALLDELEKSDRNKLKEKWHSEAVNLNKAGYGLLKEVSKTLSTIYS